MLWLFLLQAAATPSVPAPPAHPKAIFSYDDYPAEAVRNHWEGTVIADLTISPAGTPTACRIVESSGHSILDEKTCDLLIRRARFTPEKDKNGNPIESHFRTPPINWKLMP